MNSVWSSVALALLAACGSASSRGPVPPPSPRAAHLLVVGDIQLASPFKAHPSLSGWNAKRVDTGELARYVGEAVAAVHPDAILQLGDMVDLNESAVLVLPESRVKMPLAEWAPTLATFPAAIPLFPVVGNHERYGELEVRASVGPDGDEVNVENLDMRRSLSSREAGDALHRHFPALPKHAVFHGKTGSYGVVFPRYCLVSFDGADLGDPTLLPFLDARLAACDAANVPAIVADHYSFFTGRPSAEDPQLELTPYRPALMKLFAAHDVALVLSGHEHFYLRYLPEGRRRAGFEADLPARPVYATVAAFANPYLRKLERLDRHAPDADALFRYFSGTHYASVTVDDAGIHVVVMGTDGTTWREIDRFDVPPRP